MMSTSSQVRGDGQLRERPEGGSLVIVNEEPLNAETRLERQYGITTPNQAFYVRDHFPVPQLDAERWRLQVDGEVARSLTISFEMLRSMPSRTLVVTLECAGNGRIGIQPPVPGEPWQYGAVSTAEWTGVPLSSVLQDAGLLPSATEVIFEGADSGWVAGAGGDVRYARSLTREQALDPDCLLAYAMNGVELPARHGYPVRLVVPGAYGMASVKWLEHIRVSDTAFTGYYQTEQYVIKRVRGDEAAALPLYTMGIRSMLVDPAAGAVVARGARRLRGYAWSGAGAVTRVEVSTDGGAIWREAALTSEPLRYAWRAWELVWQANEPGPAVLLSRAFDTVGSQQPEEPVWNALGYANNAVQAIRVMVE